MDLLSRRDRLKQDESELNRAMQAACLAYASLVAGSATAAEDQLYRKLDAEVHELATEISARHNLVVITPENTPPAVSSAPEPLEDRSTDLSPLDPPSMVSDENSEPVPR